MSCQSEYCSLCGEMKPQVKFIFSDKSLQFGTLMKLKYLFKNILPTTTLSYAKVLCSECELSVNHIYKFCEMIQNVQKKFSLVHQTEASQGSSLYGGQDIEEEQESGLNLCHTTGITCDSEPVVIKISLVRLIHCGVCKANLGTSQLKALHEVTHGLGTVLCQCEQCGHQDEITPFLQDSNNVLCPQCSFRKFHSVDVQTQFQEDAVNVTPGIKNVNCSVQNKNNSDLKIPPVKEPSVTAEMQLLNNSSPRQIDTPWSSRSQYSDREFQVNPSNGGENFPPTNVATQKYIITTSTNAETYSTTERNSGQSSTNYLPTNDSGTKQFPELSTNNHLNHGNFPTNSSPNTGNLNLSSKSGNVGQFSLSRNHLNRSVDHSSGSQRNDASSESASMENEDLKIPSSQNDTFHFPSGKNRRKPSCKVHTCDVCTRVFNHKGHLKRHLLVHDKSIRHFLCEQCGVSFNQKSSLVTHWNSQHAKDEKKSEFSCVACGQIYKHKMSLLSHLLNNHNLNTPHPRLTTRFYCPPCDKYFITSTRLNAHSRIHKPRKVS